MLAPLTTWPSALVLLALGACGHEPTTPSGQALSGQARALAVRVTAVEPVDGYLQTRTYTGEVVARQTTDLGFEVSGRIVALEADVGSSVAAGQVLARIDSRRFETRLAEASAQLSQAEARLAEKRAGPRPEVIAAARAELERLTQEQQLATLQLGRQHDLLERAVGAQADVDIAETRLQTVRAQVARATSQLEELVTGTRKEQITAQAAQVSALQAQRQQAALDVADCVLRAPFAATVAVRHFDAGAVVELGRPIFRLVEAEQLELWIGVPSAGEVQVSTTESATIDVNGHEFAVTEARTLPELESGTRTRTLVYDLPTDAASKGVRPGEIARLSLELRVDTPGFWLPMNALTESTRGMWSCYQLGESVGDAYRVQRAEVEVLHVTVDRALVRGTLQAGDRVLTGGTQRVVPGQLVTPTDAPAK